MTIIINNDVTYYNEIKAHYQFIIFNAFIFIYHNFAVLSTYHSFKLCFNTINPDENVLKQCVGCCVPNQ